MNFKKGTAFILAFLLLVSNAGFAMTVHYCGGKISSVTSGYDKKESCIAEELVEKECCAKKIETGHKKCCSDKVVHFKGKTSDVIAKAFTSEVATPFLLPIFKHVAFAKVSAREIKITPSYYCDANAPPLFKLYHQYILYA